MRAHRAARVTMMDFAVLGAPATCDGRLFYSRDAVGSNLVTNAVVRNVRAQDRAGAGFRITGERTRWTMHVMLEGCIGHRAECYSHEDNGIGQVWARIRVTPRTRVG